MGKAPPMWQCSGPQAASDQAKDYASEARGSWKQLTGEIDQGVIHGNQ